MAAELIGACRCPVCKSDKARLTLAKSQLPVLTCNACNLQIFSRSSRSDELLRAGLIVNEAPAAPPVQPAAPSPALKPEPVHTEKPAAAPVQAKPAAPVRTGGGLSWGILRG